MQKIYKKEQISETKHVHPWFKKELLRRWPEAYIYKPPAGQYGRKGAHDFIFCIQGKFFSVEAKVEGNKMTPMQEKTMESIKAAGGMSLCLTGKDDTIFDRIESWLKG
jgi:hypothetical protein